MYPNGGHRAITFSYDDGTEHDRRLVAILNKAGLRATFHLNAGTLDTPGHLTSAEVANLFLRHEVAGHTCTHPFPSQQPNEVNLPQVLEDRRTLERLVLRPVRGFSYPFGDFAGGFKDAARAAGIDYARTTLSTGKFHWPEDFMLWHPTCHHNDRLPERWREFTDARPWGNLSLFYVWGHSYEFANDGTWDAFETFCKAAAQTEQLWRATNEEVMDYILAVRALRWNVDCTIVLNPSATSVYVRKHGEVRCLRPGLNPIA
jgi:peptidoglycan/xylan/chitin deacetylase (PgdA/CDA1 family)